MNKYKNVMMINEAFKRSDYDRALTLIKQYVERKIGGEFLEQKNVVNIYSKDIKSNLECIRFYEANEPYRSFRLNWKMNNNSTEVHSFSIYNGSSTPSVTVVVDGLSVAQYLPLLVSFLKGRRKLSKNDLSRLAEIESDTILENKANLLDTSMLINSDIKQLTRTFKTMNTQDLRTLRRIYINPPLKKLQGLGVTGRKRVTNNELQDMGLGGVLTNNKTLDEQYTHLQNIKTLATDILSGKLAKKVEVIKQPKEVDLDVEEALSGGEGMFSMDMFSENDFDSYSADERFTDLELQTKLILDGRNTSLVVTGMAGVGKTYVVEQEFKKRGMVKNEDYLYISGSGTPAAIYKELYRYNGKVALFDDADTVFDTQEGKNLFKAALDTKKVRDISWKTTTNFSPLGMTQEEIDAEIEKSKFKKFPNTFEYTGRIIFISNLKRMDFDPAILSRSTVIDITLTPEEIKDRMLSILEYLNSPNVECSKEDKLAIMDILELLVKANKIKHMTMRDFVKAIPTYMTYKEYYGASSSGKKRIVLAIYRNCISQ